MAQRAARQRDQRHAPTSKSATHSDRFERARPWLLGAAAMLFVARPLIPGVNVEHQGNDAPFVTLWLLLASLALVLQWRTGRATLRWTAVDKALLLVIALHTLSALVAGWSGAAPRPAINMLWTWIGYAAAFVIVRQMLHSAAEARALAAVMIALAVASSGYALYDYLVAQPATVAEYDLDPDAALRDIGQWYPLGSRERYLFEQRLRSTEPVATFALANSLAGFLAAWLVVVAGLLVTLREQMTSWRRTCGSLIAIGIAILLVLLLTKSRSAVVGIGIGFVVLAASRSGRKHRFSRWALAAGGVLVLAVVVAVAVGGLDLEVLGEAPKSLTYRVEYWQATWNMIAENPLWGVGPGNFKDAYTAFKLPVASEEISDPHSFLLEVWATAGTATAAAWAVFLGCVLLAAWRRDDEVSPSETAPTMTARRVEPGNAALQIAAGGLCGWLLAFALPYFAGPVIEVPLTLAACTAGVLMGGVTLGALWPWIVTGSMPAIVPLAGLVALLVNLLAAGGIGHPSVAGSLWLLAALAATATPRERPATSMTRERSLSPAVLSTGVCVALALTAAAAITLYHPVVRSHLALAAARTEPSLTEEHLTAAVEADPFGYEGRRLLAQWKFQAWQRQPADGSRKLFESAANAWLQRRPHSSEAWHQVGTWYLAMFEQTADRSTAEAAVEAFRRAVALYPNSTVRRAKLALAAAAAGDSVLASEQAAEALRLDAVMPHAEQRLTAELREQMTRMAPNGLSRP